VLKSGDVIREGWGEGRAVSVVGVGKSFPEAALAGYNNGTNPVEWLYSPLQSRTHFAPFMSGASCVPNLPLWSRHASNLVWYLYRGHLLAYSPETRRLAGELTTEGFKSGSEDPGYGPFAMAVKDYRYWYLPGASQFVVAHGILYYFGGGASLTQVIGFADPSNITDIGSAGTGLMFALTDRKIYHISNAGQIQQSIPRLAHDVMVGIGPDGNMRVLYTTGSARGAAPLADEHFLVYSPAGVLLKSQDLPALPRYKDDIHYPLMAGVLGAICPNLMHAVVLVAGLLKGINSLWTLPTTEALSDFTSPSSQDAAVFQAAELAACLFWFLVSLVLSRKANLAGKQMALWSLSAFAFGPASIVVQLSGIEVQPWKKVKKGADTAERVGATEVRQLLPERRKTSIFGATFLKELTAAWRWAALGTVGLVVGFFFELYVANGQQGGMHGVWSTVQTTMLFGSAVFGLGLSILQIYPEQSRDRWAFFVHRPASRGLLYVGKATAGLLLYVTAASVSLLLMAAWIAMPGKFPFPFVWGLTEAGWMAIFCGVMFYFAGYLVMLRPVRWFGSRLLPVFGAGLVTFVLKIVPVFWPAASVCFLFVCMFALSASFQFRVPAGGRVSAGGVASLGGVIVPGIMAVCILAIVICTGVFNMLVPNTDAGVRYSAYSMDATGAIERATYVNGDKSSKTVIKLGHPSPYSNDVGDMQMAALWPDKMTAGYDPNFWDPNTFVQEIADSNNNQKHVYWYSVNGRVVGFSGIDMNERGVMTPGGYVEGPVRNLPSEVFSGRPLANSANEDCAIVPTSRAIYYLDFSNDSVRELLTGPAAAATTNIVEVSPSDSSPASDHRRVVLSGDTVYVFSLTGALLGSFPVGDYFKGNATASIGVDSAGYLYLWLADQPYDHYYGVWTAGGGLVVKMDQSGHVVATTRLPYLPEPGIPITGNGQPWTGLMGYAMSPLISPRIIAFVFHVPTSSVTTGFVQFFGKSWKDVVAGQIIAAILCATLAWFIARRAGLRLPATLLWVAICVVTLWVGILLLLSLYQWPTMSRCPSCGKKRFLEGSSCPHCHAGWATPVLTGTEIFEEVPRPELTLIS